ncbi:MAG: hypothetical protein ABJF10_16060 [Chthoniobacter sp.]|uniref:hypothetical protein n=1 Tax=Chthoniobacter sp. TaxID=2510640 RepID=UPI0032A5E8F8
MDLALAQRPPTLDARENEKPKRCRREGEQSAQRDSSGDLASHHELPRLVETFRLALAPQIAVVLLIGAVELEEL